MILANKSLKGILPFRIGCTSYVFPHDILYNVRKLAPYVDDIELVLFESDDVCNFPDQSVIQELTDIALENNLTYTVHFPTDRDAGSKNMNERLVFLEQVEKIVGTTRNLHPYSYILHFQGIRSGAEREDITRWKEACYGVCERICALPDSDPEKICVENLFYPPAWHMDLVNEFGFSLCMDLGHFWVENDETWDTFFRDNLPKTRVIHLHGVCNGVDHISLKKNKKEDLINAMDILKCGYPHVVTLELFTIEDILQSLDSVHDIWFGRPRSKEQPER